ncbi:ribosomal-protein-alanine acetyltransferase [Salmonella enterica subsp. enterica]|uniref:Ribosomal-protein-alanine acetyltransferase n=1 Tax=Salmonella enterica I TaxID=59201 RepID=A0A379WAH4_SALET|nr:ribosomal-protein-alanine acetyltransferase [Salmonella enterica subsp. enterica]
MIGEFHKQGSAFYFALLDPEEKEIYRRGEFFQCGARFFSCLLSGLFHCAKVAGQG